MHALTMTVSMLVMSADDGDRNLSTPLTRYYANAGILPGLWIGTGVAALGKGSMVAGSQVSEQQLQLLIGMGRAQHRCATRPGVPVAR